MVVVVVVPAGVEYDSRHYHFYSAEHLLDWEKFAEKEKHPKPCRSALDHVGLNMISLSKGEGEAVGDQNVDLYPWPWEVGKVDQTLIQKASLMVR